MRGAYIDSVVRLVLVTVLAVSFVGCASFKKTVGGWFGSESARETPSAAEAQQRSVYYANVAGLKVYSAPSASSKVVGALSLHEKVTRSKVDRGYAYVESTKSGVKGWVDNGDLVWRVPTAATRTPKSPAAAAGEEPQQPAAPPATTETTVPEPPATTTTLPAAPSDSGTPSPSILDSY